MQKAQSKNQAGLGSRIPGNRYVWFGGDHKNLDEESSKALGPYPTRPTFGPAIGWLYMAVVLDVFSRMVVGWPMATIQDATLAVQALRMALARRHPQA